MQTEEFDQVFDEGKEDVLQYCDVAKTTRPNLDVQRVNVDFPKWMVARLDLEAAKIGVTRQSLIKFWLADKLGAS